VIALPPFDNGAVNDTLALDVVNLTTDTARGTPGTDTAGTNPLSAPLPTALIARARH